MGKFDFNFTRMFKWDFVKLVDRKTNKIRKYKCIFEKKEDFDTAFNMILYRCDYKNMN
jgi:hypothetical protein